MESNLLLYPEVLYNSIIFLNIDMKPTVLCFDLWTYAPYSGHSPIGEEYLKNRTIVKRIILKIIVFPITVLPKLLLQDQLTRRQH